MIHVSQPLVPTPPRVAIDGSNKGGNRGVRYNHVSQPRGVRYNPELQPRVHVVVLLGGECMHNRGVTTGLKPELQLHSPPNRVYCPRLHALGSGYFLRAVGPALEASVEH